MEKVNLVVEFERAAFLEVFVPRDHWKSHDSEPNRNTLYLYQCSLEWACQWFGKIPNKKVRPMTDEDVDRIFLARNSVGKARSKH